MSSHMIFGRQLSRDTEHRKAMRRNLIQSLFEHGKVRTTLPKAKECAPLAEKLITMARVGTVTARRRVTAILTDRRLTDSNQEFTGKTVVQKLFDEIAPQFEGRPGGYTRIIKTSDYRIGDAGDIVILQLAAERVAPNAAGGIRKSAGLRRRRNNRKHLFAAKLKKSFSSEPAGTAPAGEPAASAGGEATPAS